MFMTAQSRAWNLERASRVSSHIGQSGYMARGSCWRNDGVHGSEVDKHGRQKPYVLHILQQTVTGLTCDSLMRPANAQDLLPCISSSPSDEFLPTYYSDVCHRSLEIVSRWPDSSSERPQVRRLRTNSDAQTTSRYSEAQVGLRA